MRTSRRELLAALVIAPIAAALPVPVDPDIYLGPEWVPMREGIQAWANDLANAVDRPTYIGLWSGTILVIND